MIIRRRIRALILFGHQCGLEQVRGRDAPEILDWIGSGRAEMFSKLDSALLGGGQGKRLGQQNRSAFLNRILKQRSCERGSHEEPGIECAGRLSEDRHMVGIAAEFPNVVPSPLESSDLIQ